MSSYDIYLLTTSHDCDIGKQSSDGWLSEFRPNLGSAEGASRVGVEPHVNALRMEPMATPREEPPLLTIFHLHEANGALYLLLSRRRGANKDRQRGRGGSRGCDSSISTGTMDSSIVKSTEEIEHPASGEEDETDGDYDETA